MVLVVALSGPIIATLISPFVDQTIRNIVDDWMDSPDLYDSISITPDEYAQLPVYWRQALAEITLRPKEEAIDVQNIIKSLKAADMRLISSLAPYAISEGIFRDNSKLSEHPMPELSFSQFLHLQDTGILENVGSGVRQRYTEHLILGSEFNLRGTTVQLKFIPKSAKESPVLEVTRFTKGGKQLIDALRVPSNIGYFEWFAKNLEEKGFTVELFTFANHKNSALKQNEVQSRIERHTIQAWPPLE